jgi:predicted transcriptional regulator
MVNLQCSEIDSKELIQCTFNLKKTELRIFLYLLKNQRSISSNDIADELGLDRTTVQKSIKGLLDRDIVLRRQLNLDSGGYVFLYCVKEKEELKKQMKEIIHNWALKAEHQLEIIFEIKEK